MFRKTPEAVKEWSKDNVDMCAKRQEMLLDRAVSMLSEGGRIVYSTCTFSPEEDEGVTEHFLAAHPEFGICDGPVKVYPHTIRGEGHYAVAFARKGSGEGTVRGKDIPSKTRSRYCSGVAVHRSAKYADQVPTPPRCFLGNTLPHTFDTAGNSGCSGGRRDATKRVPQTRGNAGRRDPRSGKSLAADPQSPASCPSVEDCLSDWRTLIPYDSAGCRPARVGQAPYIREFPDARILCFGDSVYLAPEIMPDIDGLKVYRAGLKIGTHKKNRFEPDHALSHALTADEADHIVNYGPDAPEVRQYLSGMTLSCDKDLKGWCLVCVMGYPLGWAKAAGGILKNHYPRGLRRNL